MYTLKSRTEKGLHIPFLFLLIFYTPSALFKRSSHLIIFFQDISFSTVPTPGAAFRLLGNTKWRLPFVPASRLRTVTVLQLSASHPHWATCTLSTPNCVSTSRSFLALFARAWLDPGLSECQRLSYRFPHRSGNGHSVGCSWTPSSGDRLVLPKMLRGSWLTASPQH